MGITHGNSADSIYQRQLERGFRRLRFSDQLETEFRATDTLEGLKQLRVVLAIGFIFGLSITVFDYLLNGPGFSSASVPLRAAINQPMILAMILATFFAAGRRFLTPLGMIVGFLIPGGSLFMATVAEQQGVGNAVIGQLVGVFYVYFFLGLRFWPALTTAGSLMVAFLIVGAVSNAPAAALGYSGMFLLFTNLIGAVGLYNLEYSRRESFLEARQLAHIASRDPLTGIANRKAFDERLETAWATCRREQQPIMVALLDIDYFKAYNDTYGHQAGDRCLTRVARVLTQAGRRPLDLTARYGGEEFAVLLPGCSLEHGKQLIEAMREQVQALNIPHRASGTARSVTISAGLAQLFPDRTHRSLQGLVQLADEALYRAKESGRNRVVASEPEEAAATRTGVFRVGVDFDPAEVA
jgi:diguanylate cyclase (GGDEF)-like protein